MQLQRNLYYKKIKCSTIWMTDNSWQHGCIRKKPSVGRQLCEYLNFSINIIILSCYTKLPSQGIQLDTRCGGGAQSKTVL